MPGKTIYKEKSASKQKKQEVTRNLSDSGNIPFNKECPFPYLVIDEYGNIQRVNDIWLSTFGYKDDKGILGKWIGDYVSDESLKSFKNLYLNFSTEELAHSEEILFKRKDKSILKFSIIAKKEANQKQLHCIFLQQKLTGLEEISNLKSNVESISDLSTEIFDNLLNKEDFFSFIADKLTQLSGNIIISAFSTRDNDIFEIKGISGLGKMYRQLTKIFGQDPVGTKLYVSNEVKKQLSVGKVTKINASVFELFSEQLSKPLCVALEKLFNSKELFAVGFYEASRLFGISTIFVAQKKNLENISSIEEFCNIVSKAIHEKYRLNRLTEQIKKQNLLLESSTDFLYLKNKDGINTYVNEAYAKFIGKQKHEIIGKTDWEILSRNLAQKWFDSDMEVIKNKGKVKKEEKYQQKDGNLTYFQTSKHPIFNHKGEYDGLAGTSKNITAFIELNNILKDKDNTLREFINLLPDAYFELDLEFNIKHVNSKFLNLFNTSLDRSLNKNITSFVRKNEREKLSEFLCTVTKKKSKSKYELILNRKEDYSIPVIINAIPLIKDKTSIAIHGIITEKHDKKSFKQLTADIEKQFNAFIESVRELMYVADDKGNFTYINQFMADTLGYTKKKLLTMNEKELVDPETKKVFHEKFTSKLKQKGTLSVETNWTSKNGHKIHGELNIFAVYDNYGNYTGSRGIFYDITEIHQSKKEIRKLFKAVEQSPISIIITNNKGIIEFVNPKFTEVTGYSSEEVIGEKPNILKSGKHNKDFYKDLWDTILAGSEWKGEFQNIKKNGETYWEYASISGVKNELGKITHFVAIKEDITERKKAEEELIKAKEKAEQADKIKTAFLSNMSHEIRTPMNAIIGFSELLKIPELVDDKKIEYINHIYENGKVLLKLFEDIIDIARIESGDLEINKKDFDLCELLNHVYDIFKSRQPDTKVDLILDVDCENNLVKVYSDPTRLQQVLYNLIENALKFTKKGHVKFGFKIINDFELHFYVKDTGIGLSKEQQVIIFDLFRQVDDSATREFGGTGIGLTISKNLVSLLGGKIWLESEKSKGTTFNFTIPYKKEPTSISEKTDGSTRNDWSNKTILIAEDNESNFLFLQEILNKTNINIIWAKDGNEAVELYKNTPGIDVILMDVQMPILNGYEATKLIKQSNPEVPIIAQTAYALPGEEERSIEAGCDGYIAKPISVKKLSGVLAEFFN